MGSREREPPKAAQWALVAAAFALIFAALFSPVLFADRTLAPPDAALYYYPHFVARHWLWTPALYSGYPVFADPQAMTWYPPAVLLGWIPGSWNAFVVLAYTLAGSNMFGLVARLTGSRLAGATSGLVYAGSGFAIAHLEHTSMLHVFAWAPAVLWSLEELRRGADARWLAGVSVAIALAALAGHPQLFAYLGILAAAHVLYRTRDDPRQRYIGWGRAGVALVLGIGVASILFVPMLELAGESIRGADAPSRALELSLLPGQLSQLLFPFIHGGWTQTASLAAVTYAGGDSLIESTGFVGLVPLALSGLALTLRPRDPDVRFYGFAAMIALLLCLGDSLPFAGWLGAIPGLDRFRIPARLLFVTTLALSVLSGLGLAALRSLPIAERMRVLRRALLALGLLVGIAWLAVLLAPSRGAAPVPSRNPLLALQAATLAISIGALLLTCRNPSRKWSFGLVAAIGLELASFGAFASWRDSPNTEEAFGFPEPLRGVHDDLARGRQRSVTLTAFGPALAAPPNRNQIWEIPSVIGYGPLPLGRYAELLRLAPAGHLGRADELARLLGPDDRSLDLLAARYLLVPGVTHPAAGRDPFLPTRTLLERSDRWDRHTIVPGVTIYENRQVLERAWIADRLQVGEADEILATIRLGRLTNGERFDPRRIALVEDDVGPLSCQHPCGSAMIVSQGDTHIEVQTQTRGEAMLVLSEVAYPGWNARLDDTPVPIVRTDFVLRGVRVPAGEHRVRLTFRPRSLFVGASITGFCLLLLVAHYLRSGLGARTADRDGSRPEPGASADAITRTESPIP